ncbi:hypothetical protein QUW40_06135 [Collinsella tanakaei]|uniref:hypothetical protein n=1 Tax=Collinsella tanakaei TaxID=626935 RepID=UPI0025A476EF|nr:hypothetical protein [Collinsella tanakaei]MDM8246177.1 hypothetical protein [Collinsella tanakaei]
MTDVSTQTQKKTPWRRTGAIIVLCALALAAIGSTLALKEVDAQADNIMSFGNVKIQVSETEWDAMAGENGEGAWVDVTDEAISSRYGKAERRVQFTNVGEHPIFVRAKLGMVAVNEGDDGEAVETDVPAENLSYTLNTNPAEGGEFATGWTAGDPANEEQAGWYFYNAILEPGETTEPLVTAIEMTDYNDLARANDSFKFHVLGQGVQSEHQVDETTGAAITEAVNAHGWPDPGDDGVNHEAATQSNDLVAEADETNGNATTEEGQE